MTRISKTLLVQRVDDLIVVMDESQGQEVTLPIAQSAAVIQAVSYLSGSSGPAEAWDEGYNACRARNHTSDNPYRRSI